MIKVRTLKTKQKQQNTKICELKMKRIMHELSTENFSLSDEFINFQINPNICIKNNFIAIQIQVMPKVGLYNQIDFGITIFLEDSENFKQPKIFNDRRIFHPNINPYTLEIVFPELIQWNPTHSLLYILRRLKYTLIEPNNACIINNPICRKAAYLYKIDRQNYRNYVVQYCPTVLDNIVMKQNQISTSSNIDIENEGVKKYVKIQQILPLERVKQYKENKQEQFDDGFQFLSKKISKIKIGVEQLQNQKYFNYFSNFKDQMQQFQQNMMNDQ